MNVQTVIVVLCVLAAAAYVLRPALRRWLTPRKAGLPGGVAVLPEKTSGAACGGCKACPGSSGGCH